MRPLSTGRLWLQLTQQLTGPLCGLLANLVLEDAESMYGWHSTSNDKAYSAHTSEEQQNMPEGAEDSSGQTRQGPPKDLGVNNGSGHL